MLDDLKADIVGKWEPTLLAMYLALLRGYANRQSPNKFCSCRDGCRWHHVLFPSEYPGELASVEAPAEGVVFRACGLTPTSYLKFSQLTNVSCSSTVEIRLA